MHPKYALFLLIVAILISCNDQNVFDKQNIKYDEGLSIRAEISLQCEPDTLEKGDTLLIRMDFPHGGDLAIIDPKDRYFYLAESQVPAGQEKDAVIDSEVFKNLIEYKIYPPSLLAVPSIYGYTNKEKVFDQVGDYEIRMGENLKTSGDIPFYSCTIHLTSS